MPRPMQRSRPANRPGQTRGGRRGQLEAFERRAEAANATAARAAEAGPIELPAVVSVADLVDRSDLHGGRTNWGDVPLRVRQEIIRVASHPRVGM